MYRLDAKRTFVIETSANTGPLQLQQLHGLSGFFHPPSPIFYSWLFFFARSTAACWRRVCFWDAEMSEQRTAELMLRTHTITRIDSFSSTMNGHAWYAWEWLYHVLGTGIGAWGLNGVVFFSALLGVGATFVIVFTICAAPGSQTFPWRPSCWCSPLVLAVFICWRGPHLLSWLFFAVVWFQIVDSSASEPSSERRRLYWFSLFMLVWVNVHGGILSWIRASYNVSGR